jgi:uncharacterized spore protein YtfJ
MEVVAMIEEILSRIGQVHDRASVKTVFGEPLQIDGRTIIPVAKVRYGFGLGFGGVGRAKKEREEQEPSGEGGGGGAGVSVTPVALLEITAQETKVKPVVDVTRLAVAGMLLAAWNVLWIAYTIRRIAAKRM